MKVVLFCGGLGTRIREYSESVPKPMIPVGNQPILWHVMQYYSQYGHRDFVLCLGYKANTIKDFFLNWRQQPYSDCVVSDAGRKVELLGEQPPDWRVTLVDTGIWRNIGQRLLAVQRARQERADVSRQLQRRSVGRAAAGDGRTAQEERQGRLLSGRAAAAHLPPRRVRQGRQVSSACAPAPIPTSGPTPATSSSPTASSTTSRKARNWWSSPSSG